MDKCSGGENVSRNPNLFHVARQWSGCIALTQCGCSWGSTSALTEFAGSVAVSAIEIYADSLTGLGIDAAVDRGIKTSRATSTMCIANIV